MVFAYEMGYNYSPSYWYLFNNLAFFKLQIYYNMMELGDVIIQRYLIKITLKRRTILLNTSWEAVSFKNDI